MRVADALAEPERAAMDPVGAGEGRINGIDDAKPAVAVAVPVEPSVRLHLVQHPSHVADHGPDPVGRRVANRVADGDPRRPLLDRRAEQLAKRFGLGPGGVFGDVEHRQPLLVGKAHGLAGVVNHLLDGPALGVLPDRTGADEGRDLDGDADPLRDLDHRLDVALEGARGTERLDAHPLVADFLGQPCHVGGGAWSRCRQPEIDRADTKLVSEMKEAQLMFDVGVSDGRALDPVAQRLVVKVDRVRRLRWRVDRVPVVDQLGFVRHGSTRVPRPAP